MALENVLGLKIWCCAGYDEGGRQRWGQVHQKPSQGRLLRRESSQWRGGLPWKKKYDKFISKFISRCEQPTSSRTQETRRVRWSAWWSTETLSPNSSQTWRRSRRDISTCLPGRWCESLKIRIVDMYISIGMRATNIFPARFWDFCTFQHPRRIQGVEAVRPSHHCHTGSWRLRPCWAGEHFSILFKFSKSWPRIFSIVQTSFDIFWAIWAHKKRLSFPGK